MSVNESSATALVRFTGLGILCFNRERQGGEIKNMDYNANAVYSDMPDHYKYLSSADGHRIELSPIIEDADAGSAVGRPINTMDFRHPIVVDDPPSIDQLGG
jgi:hypothetical protein